LEQADQQEGSTHPPDPQLSQKLARLRERQAKRQAQLAQLETSGESQVAEVVEDARLLNKRAGTVAGYNIQAAVDEKHKLIVAAEVVQDGNDQQQLAPMGKKAKEVLGMETLITVQGSGYFNAQQIKECVEHGITPTLLNQTNRHRRARRAASPGMTSRTMPMSMSIAALKERN